MTTDERGISALLLYIDEARRLSNALANAARAASWRYHSNDVNSPATPTVIPAQALRRRSFPTAPVRYQGTRADFIASHLEQILPDVLVVERLHDALVEYVRREDSLFLVRGVRGMKKGVSERTHTGTMLSTDNAPAWWWHSVLFNDALGTQSFDAMVRSTPFHLFHLSGLPTVNDAGWHLAHMLDAKDGNTT